MNILEYFEAEAFNELMQIPFPEVRKIFNQHGYYVPSDRMEAFIREATQAKEWYEEELRKIEEYAKGEYAASVNSGIYIPEYSEPQFKAKGVEIQTQRKLIRIIKEYFDKETFNANKYQLYGLNAIKTETVETPHELLISLNRIRKKIYSLLSIIGYYQRHQGYFLQATDYINICKEYSWQVYRINKSLGMRFRFVDIFLSSKRIKPSNNRDDEDTQDESYQSNKFIDIDNISLLALIHPYLRYNTKEINTIIQIMSSNLYGRNGGTAWDNTLDEVKRFITNCEFRGIMKKVR